MDDGKKKQKARYEELKYKFMKTQIIVAIRDFPSEPTRNANELFPLIHRGDFYEELPGLYTSNIQLALKRMKKEGLIYRDSMGNYKLEQTVKRERITAKEIAEYEILYKSFGQDLDIYQIRNLLIIVGALLLLGILLAILNGGDGDSKKKYNDLNDVEKENAKWAYEVQQGLNN